MEVLHRYIVAYHETAVSHLNGRGQPVVDWLAKIIENEKVNGRS